ncbi:MAG: hypothetical protein K8S55_13875 [Phycisphaerae bacterium]|nr:hypothetical protein [Phycisphaerae bacterium]
MTFQMTVSAMVILMVFYLVLVIKWYYVRRPNYFLLGSAAIALSLLLSGVIILIDDSWFKTFLKVLNLFLTITAFGCAILTCYNAELPKSIPGTEIENDSEDEAKD